jgi:hypothetical protein
MDARSSPDPLKTTRQPIPAAESNSRLGFYISRSWVGQDGGTGFSL